MTRDQDRSVDRANFLYELLTDQGVYDADDSIDDWARRKMVEQAIDDLVEKSESFYGTKKSQITRNIGRAAFLHAYVAGEDEVTLQNVVAELGWSRGHKNFDRLAFDNMKPYPKLLREIEAAKNAPAEIDLSEMENPGRDLDESILTAIEQGRIPQGYGGLLRLYLGKVEAPLSTKPDVLYAAYAQASGKLKIDIARRTNVNDMPPEVVRGLTFLERYNAGFDIPSIAQDEFPIARKGQDVLVIAIRQVESLMALAIEELYK